MEYVLIAESIVIVLLSCIIVILCLNQKKRANDIALAKEEIGSTKEVTGGFEAYERVVPVELFQVLGMKNMSDISLNEQKELEATIMDVNISNFREITAFMEPQKTYSYINCLLSECIPVIYDYGGVVDHFEDAGLSAIFTEYHENALNAAVIMCEYLFHTEFMAKEYSKFSVGLSHGTVMVGVVGHERRLATLTLSAYTGFTNYLQKISGKYYSRVLVTGNYAKLIEDFSKKFNSRFIGYMYIQSIQVIEKIYDVFDGDEVHIRNIKRKTKMVFEKGVKLYSERKFEEARVHFIEVLKTDRLDHAAKEYVLLCEKNTEDEYKGDRNIYIEIY